MWCWADWTPDVLRVIIRLPTVERCTCMYTRSVAFHEISRGSILGRLQMWWDKVWCIILFGWVKFVFPGGQGHGADTPYASTVRCMHILRVFGESMYLGPPNGMIQRSRILDGELCACSTEGFDYVVGDYVLRTWITRWMTGNVDGHCGCASASLVR